MEQNVENKEIKPTFWKLFWLFLKVSFFTFGGGNALFPMIRNYCVEKYHWIEDQDIDDILIVTNSIPGAAAIEGIVYISLLLLKSKWKAILVTMLSLLPHTLLFFVIFFVGYRFIPMEYLRIIYVAVVPIIIALLLNLSIRYLKVDHKGIPVTIHWMVFSITLVFSVFVPVPWSMPIFVILFFVLCLIIYKKIKTKKEDKND